MAKVLFEKIFQVALKKKRKNFQNLQGVEALCEKKKNSKSPREDKNCFKRKIFSKSQL